MSRSLPSRSTLLVLAVVAVVLSPLFTLLPLRIAAVVAAAATVAALVGVLASLRDSTTEGAASDGGSSAWDHIPSWQYDGRHVESGGLTRNEQEQAIDEVTEEAERRDPDHPNP